MNLDTITLRCFIAIAEKENFTEAAEYIGRTQSALSLQIKKLEETLGHQLFFRSNRHVKLTEHGEVFLSYARRIIHLQSELENKISEPEIEGEIKFGTPEDFATHYLPSILGGFAEHYPKVSLNVRCDLTLNLIEGFKKNEFDLVLVKREPDEKKLGTKFWREPLVWAVSDSYNFTNILQLVLSPQPCIYRKRALTALDNAKIPWHITYTSPSLSGTIAAVKAGLGVAVLPANMLPQGVHAIKKEVKLPKLADAEIALLKAEKISKASEKFAEHIIKSFENH
jgi:DNA-binding transcriptional LysR family regulator